MVTYPDSPKLRLRLFIIMWYWSTNRVISVHYNKKKWKPKGAKALVGAQVNNVWTRISNSNTRPFFLQSRERKIIDEERAGLGRHFQLPGVSLWRVVFLLDGAPSRVPQIGHFNSTTTRVIFNFLIFFLKSIQILKIWNQFYGSLPI